MKQALAAALALAGAALALSGEARAEPRPDIAAVARRVVDSTNEYRAAHDLPPLTVNRRLAETAGAFVELMARTDEHSHHAGGTTPAQRVRARGYDYCVVMENIAYAYSSAGFGAGELAGRFMAGWKESNAHRENLLDAQASEIGVAVARSAVSGRYYVVQMLARPRAKGCVAAQGR